MRLAVGDPVLFLLGRRAAVSEPRRPVRPAVIKLEAVLLGQRRENVAVGRMQPLAAEVERQPVLFDRPGAPAGALARLQHQHRDAGRLGQSPPRGDPGGAGADHRDIDLGG